MYNSLSKKQKKILIRILVGLILFIIGIFLKINILLLSSYIIVGYDVVLKAIKNIRKGLIFDENFLITVATFGAIITKDISESAAIVLFYQIGEFFQNIAVEKSRESIANLMDLYPEEVNLVTETGIEVVLPEEVNLNDKILVKPGEKIALDGIIIEGESMIDTSMITGESVPRKVKEKDEVLSGCINTSNTIVVQVNKTFEDSTASKILELVENSTSKKAKSEKFITKFAKYYTPIVVFSACLLAVIPPIYTKTYDFNEWVHRALILLVVSCPCALVISVPLGFFGGIGACSKRGILIKGSNYLELLSKADTFVFDKTGTLTKGKFEVLEINALHNISKEELLEYACYGEIDSNHPIGISIKNYYNKNLDREKITSYTETSGFGTEVVFDNKKILVGNANLMQKYNIEFKEIETRHKVIYVALNNEYIGYILIGDEIKEESKEVIKKLDSTTIMLTGDNKKVADIVGKELNIDKIYSELLPMDKMTHLEEVLKENEKNVVVFVGDGMNDAPVLARADIGIAMGGLGSDAAIEAANVVIMDDDLRKIVISKEIAKKTMSIVKQNIVLALFVKFLVLILAGFGEANMWEAIFSDVGVSVLAILNSMRMLK